MVDDVPSLGTPRECREQMEAFVDAGVREIRLVLNEKDKDAFLYALRAVAARAERGSEGGDPPAWKACV